MSIQVENNLKKTSNEATFEQRAHYIPCKIDDDGAANVSKYFEPYVRQDGDGDLSATFRGHPLNGRHLDLPAGYRAVVLTEARRPLTEDSDRRFQVAGGFKELTLWNWDKKPSPNDHLLRATDWIDIANAIHGD